VGAPVSATRPAQARTKLFAAVFDNATGQEQYDPAAQGMGDLVAVMLAQQDNVAVVERQKLDALAAEQARSLKGLTGEQFAVSAGKLLKANLALTGRLFLLNGKLTVNVQAIDIETSRVVAADQYTTAPESLVEGSFQVARNLAKQMAMPMPAVDLAKIDKSPLASLHFAKALSHYYAGNLDPALMQFMRAVDLDPDYTEVHYWSGLCYSKQGEHADAVIEWEQFLKDQPDSKYAPQVKKLLAEAKALEKVSAAPRLAPASAPATQPAKDSTNGQ